MKKAFKILVIIFVLMQFIVTNKPNYPIDKSIALHPPKDVEAILKKACYDCHSNHTNYPWYSYVAPFSWTIRSHIKEGRKALNFSKWKEIPKDRLAHKLDRIIDTVRVGVMPIPSYTWIHKDAKLTKEEKKKIIDYFGHLRQNL